MTGVCLHANPACCLQDKRLAWYDMDLSTKPYRALHYHSAALRCVAYHPTYPLFASASDDATIHIFHGMVYQVTQIHMLMNAQFWMSFCAAFVTESSVSCHGVAMLDTADVSSLMYRFVCILPQGPFGLEQQWSR